MLCWRCGRRLVLALTPPRRALAGTVAAATWQRGWTASIRAPPQRPYSSDSGDTLKVGGDEANGAADQPPRPRSIFDELFPGGAKPAWAEEDVDPPDERETRQRENEDDGDDDYPEDLTADKTPLSPADDPSAVPEEIRHWLDDETHGNERGLGQGQPEGSAAATAAAPTKPAPTVLVLSGTSASLLPSDFFRIAPRAPGSRPRGRRSSSSIDGWAAARGGLYKVVQDRDPVTLAPRGRYFLYFGSAAGALAYAQEARALHALARRALGLDGVRVGVAATARRGTADDAAAAALRAFTLVAPSARLDLVMEVPQPAVAAAAAAGFATAAAAADGTTGTTTGGRSVPSGPDDDAPAASTKVLLVFTGHGPDSLPTPGDGTTVDGVRRLLAADGAIRNVPWGVSEGLNGVVPVPWVVAERRRLEELRWQALKAGGTTTTGGGGASHHGGDPRLPDIVAKTDAMNEHALYTRFVVSFADAVEARRFVRVWHRRSVKMAWSRKRPQEEEEAAEPTPAEQQTGLDAVAEATVLW